MCVFLKGSFQHRIITGKTYLLLLPQSYTEVRFFLSFQWKDKAVSRWKIARMIANNHGYRGNNHSTCVTNFQHPSAEHLGCAVRVHSSMIWAQYENPCSTFSYFQMLCLLKIIIHQYYPKCRATIFSQKMKSIIQREGTRSFFHSTLCRPCSHILTRA